jgi:hypothetical protein
MKHKIYTKKSSSTMKDVLHQEYKNSVEVRAQNINNLQSRMKMKMKRKLCQWQKLFFMLNFFLWCKRRNNVEFEFKRHLHNFFGLHFYIFRRLDSILLPLSITIDFNFLSFSLRFLSFVSSICFNHMFLTPQLFYTTAAAAMFIESQSQ